MEQTRTYKGKGNLAFLWVLESYPCVLLPFKHVFHFRHSVRLVGLEEFCAKRSQLSGQVLYVKSGAGDRLQNARHEKCRGTNSTLLRAKMRTANVEWKDGHARKIDWYLSGEWGGRMGRANGPSHAAGIPPAGIWCRNLDICRRRWPCSRSKCDAQPRNLLISLLTAAKCFFTPTQLSADLHTYRIY